MANETDMPSELLAAQNQPVSQTGDVIPAGAAADPDDIRASGIAPGDKQYGDDEVRPEEQAQYDQLVEKFAKIVYDRNTDVVIEHLNDKNVPVYKAVAKTTVMLMDQVVSGAEQNRVELFPDAVFFATSEAISIVMDVGSMAEIWPFKRKSDEYVNQQNMAFAEAQKIIGEAMLSGEDADEYRLEAQDNAAHRISMESQAGQLAPGYDQAVAGMAGNPQMNMSAPGVSQQMQQGGVVPMLPGGGPQQTPVAQGVQQVVGSSQPGGQGSPPPMRQA